MLLVGGRMVAHGTLDIGTFLFFNVLVVMLVMPLRMLGMWVGQSQRATASGERIFEIMDEPEEISDRPDAGDMPPGEGRVRYEHVSFEYAPGRLVLQDIDLELEPGRTVALIGHTGSGKTTLASLVPRFYDATEGRITIDGVDVRDVKLQSLRREIGIVSQDPFLFSATGAREHLLRAGGRDRRGDRSGGDARAGARVHRRAPRRLRHDHRRARDHPLRRPAPAARHRARADHGTAHPDPRRRDRLGGRDDRGADPPGPARGDEGADDDHHRPPPLDDLARRRARRARPRAQSSDAAPTRSCSRRIRSTATSTSTASSSASSRSGSKRGRRDESLATRRPPHGAPRREGRGLVVAAHGSARLDARPAGGALQAPDDSRARVARRRNADRARTALPREARHRRRHSQAGRPRTDDRRRAVRHRRRR